MRTTSADYLSLITPYHRGKPNFSATVEMLADAAVELGNALRHMPEDFDLDVAVGKQLDIVGKWVGRSRYVPIPVPAPWFSFGDALRGWGRGIWKGPYSTGTELSALEDETYRLLLKAKIAANNWDGRKDTAEAALRIMFSDPETLIWIDDQSGLRDIVCVAGKLPSIVLCFLLELGLIPVKAGGMTRTYCFTSRNRTPLFGFGVSNDFIAGWGSGSWGVNANWLLTHSTT